MTSRDRIIKFVEYKGISKNKFYKETGLSNGFLDKNNHPGADKIEKIIYSYPELCAEWLITGEGSMLKNDTLYNIPQKLTAHRADKGIPLVEAQAIADFWKEQFSIRASDVREYYVIPKFKDCKIDFMVEIAGDAMYPKYASGDVVACTVIKESSFVQWGKVYLIGTHEQGILIKRVYPGAANDSVECRSDNEKYPPFEVQKKEMTGLALIVGVIRLE